jgi:tetratricopeptide (TPR) repeat protein
MRKMFIFLLIFCAPLIVFSADLMPLGDLNSAEAYYRQGKDFLNKGDYIHANEYFKKAEKILGGNEYVVPMPESVLHIPPATGLPPLQEAAFVPAQADSDNSIEVKARVSFIDGDYQEAENLYKQILLKYPKNTSLLYNLALSYVGLKDYVSAREVLESILQIAPSDLNVLYNLGVICESYLGELERAVFYYRKYLSYAGNSPDVKNVQVWVKYLEQQVH